MEQFFIFFKQNWLLVIVAYSMFCITLGIFLRARASWGKLTDPDLVLKKGQCFKILNIYTPKGWSEHWTVSSIVCLEKCSKKPKIIYISEDRVSFVSEDDVEVGQIYKVVQSKIGEGQIILKKTS